ADRGAEPVRERLHPHAARQPEPAQQRRDQPCRNRDRIHTISKDMSGSVLVTNKSTKPQSPNPKEIPIVKLQDPGCVTFGVWEFGIFWCLEFGIWCFRTAATTRDFKYL